MNKICNDHLSCLTDCVCPLADKEQHSWKEICSSTVPMKIQDAFKLVFIHEKFMVDVLAGRKINSELGSNF